MCISLSLCFRASFICRDSYPFLITGTILVFAPQDNETDVQVTDTLGHPRPQGKCLGDEDDLGAVHPWSPRISARAPSQNGVVLTPRVTPDT